MNFVGGLPFGLKLENSFSFSGSVPERSTVGYDYGTGGHAKSADQRSGLFIDPRRVW
jgi:hypothetical protein